jgi:hypothetical protein
MPDAGYWIMGTGCWNVAGIKAPPLAQKKASLIERETHEHRTSNIE